jgi:SAM-dependent methyltransferase
MEKSSFPHLYDEYLSQYNDDLPFWCAMAETLGYPVLELGCGTGRVILALAKSEYPVEGIDNDPIMLDLARSKLFPRHHESVTFHNCDIRHFKLTNQFPLIVIPCNTFAYFSEGDCELILRCSKEHLLPDGHLVMELPSPESGCTQIAFDLQEGETEIVSTFISPRTEHPVQVSALRSTGPKDNTIDITWYFDELLPDGSVERFDHKLRYHLRAPRIVTDLLVREGFNEIEVYGDYNLSPYSVEANSLILKCQSGGKSNT